ncbi:MAG: FKBP-type peptidyl-prolyl cis-trans isomerase [Bdellovibrionales bacterium]|nr:FKBP-type peptidyl-prolyl cis-trans isomerase [Bdellovibrionales bacterium]
MTVQVVSFHCTLKNKFGQVIGKTYNQNVINDCQSDTNSLAALVEEMRDLKKGEKRRIHLNAERAYGLYNPELVIIRNFEELEMSHGEPMKVGEKVVFVTNGQPRSFRVVHVTGHSVTLDGNHPLAGQDLIFEIEATAAREATSEEIDAARSENSAIWYESNTVH